MSCRLAGQIVPCACHALTWPIVIRSCNQITAALLAFKRKHSTDLVTSCLSQGDQPGHLAQLFSLPSTPTSTSSRLSTVTVSQSKWQAHQQHPPHNQLLKTNNSLRPSQRRFHRTRLPRVANQPHRRTLSSRTVHCPSFRRRMMKRAALYANLSKLVHVKKSIRQVPVAFGPQTPAYARLAAAVVCLKCTALEWTQMMHGIPTAWLVKRSHRSCTHMQCDALSVDNTLCL